MPARCILLNWNRHSRSEYAVYLHMWTEILSTLEFVSLFNIKNIYTQLLSKWYSFSSFFGHYIVFTFFRLTIKFINNFEIVFSSSIHN